MNANRRGGFPTPRAQFINNGFGLGEFFDKRGLIGRQCFPHSNWAIFTDWPTKILPELDDSAIGSYIGERETRTLEVISFEGNQHYYETNPTSYRFLMDD